MSLVATETFEVEYEGTLETIIAGVTHVIEGHEIARRFPSKFKKTRWGEAPRSLSRPRRATAPTSAPPRETHPWRLPEPTIPTESWRLGPIPNAPRAGTWAEFEWKRSAAHEAAHAAAAHLIGWEVTAIRLNPDGGGHAEVLSPVGCRGRQRADRLAFIAATAEKHCGWTSNRNSYNGDRRMIREALSYTRNDMEAAVLPRQPQSTGGRAHCESPLPKNRALRDRCRDYLTDRGREFGELGGRVLGVHGIELPNEEATIHATVEFDDDTGLRARLRAFEHVRVIDGRAYRWKYGYRVYVDGQHEFRYDRDPTGHPEMPEHKHTAGSDRRTPSGRKTLHEIGEEVWEVIGARPVLP